MNCYAYDIYSALIYRNLFRLIISTQALKRRNIGEGGDDDAVVDVFDVNTSNAPQQVCSLSPLLPPHLLIQLHMAYLGLIFGS